MDVKKEAPQAVLAISDQDKCPPPKSWVKPEEVGADWQAANYQPSHMYDPVVSYRPAMFCNALIRQLQRPSQVLGQAILDVMDSVQDQRAQNLRERKVPRFGDVSGCMPTAKSGDSCLGALS